MAVTLNASSTAGFVTTADTSTILQLQTNGTTAVTVDDSQRVAFVAGTAALPAITTTGDTNTGIFFPAADTIAFAEGGAEAMRINSSGNVGIGTSSPAVRLHVSGSSTYVAGIEGSSTFALMGFKASGTTGTLDDANVAIGATGDALYLRAGGTERARIDSSGNLLVGTTNANPAGRATNSRIAAIQSGGDTMTLQQPSNSYLNIVSHVTTTSGTRYHIAFGDGTSFGERGVISTNGSSTTYATSSDHRLKNTITPMTGALAKVAQLKPVTYKWNIDGSEGEGFIAHELQEVIPDCVTGEKDAVDAEGNPQYQGIDTSFLVATLTAAIKEQQTLIESLTQRITALEGQ